MTSYLLDTHAWLWLALGDPRVPRPLIDELETALGGRRVALSQISIWELAHKVALGKIELNRPVDRWLREASADLLLLDLPVEVVLESTRLPGAFHKDPADRLIVATARVHGLTLVTADRPILDYARAGHVKVAAL